MSELSGYANIVRPPFPQSKSFIRLYYTTGTASRYTTVCVEAVPSPGMKRARNAQETRDPGFLPLLVLYYAVINSAYRTAQKTPRSISLNLRMGRPLLGDTLVPRSWERRT